MIIDMSQTAVNRTAIYTISLDILRILGDQKPACQYFGQVFAKPPASRTLQELQRAGFDRIFSGSFGRGSASAYRPTGVGPTLYIDPLYCLLGDLASDDIVTVLDLTPVTRPNWHAPHVSRAYDAAFDLISRRRPRVVAISQNTADTLYANYGYPPELVTVVKLYVPGHFERSDEVDPLHSPWPYVLFVGSLETRKNLVGAIRSFELSGLAESGYKLLIVGGEGHGAGEIAAAARRVPNVQFCGYVSNAELRSIYAGAAAFIYPSYLEGFGVPLIEAMNYGIPAAASWTGACPEVGGDLVRYFDPDDHRGFSRELVRLVGLSPDELAAYKAAARRWVDENFSVARFEIDLRRALGLPEVAVAPEAPVDHEVSLEHEAPIGDEAPVEHDAPDGTEASDATEPRVEDEAPVEHASAP